MNDHLVPPDSKINLKHRDPSAENEFGDGQRKKAEEKTRKLVEKLDSLQTRLYANKSRALLIVLQGMDTAGKDGTIKHVMSGVNPQGCRVTSFKAPTPLERSHDFLWRIHQEVPPLGYIGIFNRSHYEDVLVTHVHKLVPREIIEKRYKQINQFEKLLTKNGTKILKFFLHISKDEQRERLQSRIDDAQKRWKFTPQDIEERALWPAYQKAYEETLAATSTKHAAWTIVPANRKWYRNLVVAEAVVAAMEKMDLQFPPAAKGVDFKTLKIK